MGWIKKTFNGPENAKVEYEFSTENLDVRVNANIPKDELKNLSEIAMSHVDKNALKELKKEMGETAYRRFTASYLEDFSNKLIALSSELAANKDFLCVSILYCEDGTVRCYYGNKLVDSARVPAKDQKLGLTLMRSILGNQPVWLEGLRPK